MTESKILYTPEVSGEKDGDFPGNAEVLKLRDEPRLGAATYLVRLPAGGEIVPHSHGAAAQHFVLEGECESGGEMRKAGTYHLIPAHESVGPVTSSKGAALLIILDPAAS